MQIEVISPWVLGSRNQLKAAQDYPAEWTDVTGQRDEEIVRGAGRAVGRGKVSNAQATAIAANPAYVVLWQAEDDADPPASLTAPQVDALRTKIAGAYSADISKLVTLDTVSPVAIADSLKEAACYPVWESGRAVTAGEVWQYGGNLFECIQGHTPLANWQPTVAHALWKRYYEPTDDPWPWVQPQGAHDAYPVGARVTYNGHTWANTIPANVWQPGVTGWTDETPTPPVGAWAFPVAYKVGDRVTYQGSTYSCRQAHTSESGWTPPVVPALWLLV